MVRAAPVRPSFPLTNTESNMPRRPQQPSDDSSVQPRPTNPRPATPTVRTLPIGAGEPATVKPRRFDQAQEIADRFKEGLPVIMNLENTDRDVKQQLQKFAVWYPAHRAEVDATIDGTTMSPQAATALKTKLAARAQWLISQAKKQ